MKRTLGMAIALALGAPAFAFANDAFVVADISLQSGPDQEYPPIGDLPAGTEVDVQGCIEGFSWCDVVVGGDRGWIPGSYVEEEYDSHPVFLIDYGPRIGVPVVSFSIGTYWDAHYHNRPFYAQRGEWTQRHFEARPPPRPSVAQAPPIPNHGGNDHRGNADRSNAGRPDQRAATPARPVAAAPAPAPKPVSQHERAPAHPVETNRTATTTHTETVKRATTERTSTAATPQAPAVHTENAPQPRQVAHAPPPPKPQNAPKPPPKEAPKEERKDDEHGH